MPIDTDTSVVQPTGQTNYGYANASLDILAERRRADGLPALAVEWGVIDHVGVADKNIQVRHTAGRSDLAVCRLTACHQFCTCSLHNRAHNSHSHAPATAAPIAQNTTLQGFVCGC